MRRPRLLFCAALLPLLLPAAPATAQMLTAIVGNQPAAGASYTGPGDVTTMTAWYGLWAYTAATAASTNKLINVKRASDSHTCDIKSTTTGGLGNTASCSTGGDNGTLWTTWCASTTCNVVTMYDLTGNGWDVTYSGSASSLAKLIDSCLNTSLPCIEMPLTGGGGTTEFTTSGNFTPATGVMSIAAVFNRIAGTTEILWVSVTSGELNRLKSESPANFLTCRGNTGNINNTSVTDAAWHQSTCVINGASSAFDTDGSTTTGTIGGNTAAGHINIEHNNGSTGNIGRFAEGGFADNVAWDATTLAALHANQSARLGTP